MREDPCILFLPVSCATGIGEYVRSLTLAQGIKKRWPQAKVKFVLNRDAPYAKSAPFDSLLVPGSATHNIEAVNDLIRDEKPDLVLFDNAGRVAQLKCARKVGARTIFISARPHKRRKAFAWRWISRLDQHWITNPALNHRSLSFWERMRLRAAGSIEILFLPAVFPESDPTRRDALKNKLGLLHAPYLLFAAGGGGWSVAGKPTAEIFAEAAGLVASETDLSVVTVMGPLHKGHLPSLPGVITVPSVSNQHMIDLIHDARLLALGGGSIVFQAIALRRVCVAAAIGGRDQNRRVHQLAQQGMIEAAEPTPTSLSHAILRLLNDRDRMHAIQARVDDSGVSSGLSMAMDAIERLLDAPPAGGKGTGSE